VNVDVLQRQEDSVGEFFRQVALQRKGMHLGRSTQGHYAFTATGKLLWAGNTREEGLLRRHLQRIARTWSSQPATAEAPAHEALAARVDPTPEGTTSIAVYSRVLEAQWPTPRTDEERHRQQSLGRDTLWITAGELAGLCQDPPELADSLLRRIVRFHVVDNTRSTPLQWGHAEVRELQYRLQQDGDTLHLQAETRCRSQDERRTCKARLEGQIEVGPEGLRRFDLVSLGVFATQEGKWSTGSPPGEYTVGTAFQRSPSTTSFGLIPRGATQGVDTYLRATCSSLDLP
jgi:hypothetical protein